MVSPDKMRKNLILLLCGAACIAGAATLRVHFLDRSVIEERLRENPRKNREREEVLRRHFEEAGCKDSNLAEQPVLGTKNPNLICSAPGEMDREIVVGAHFDFVDAGTGIIDNWSGASLLPALYAGLGNVPRRHRFVFIAFTDEEKGLVGSRAYVQKLGRDNLAKISAMVNMDSLGTSPTKVETVRGDPALLQSLLIASQTLHVPLSVVNVHKVGRSDSDSFQDKHVPTVDLHSITQSTFPYLHSYEDRVAHIDFDAYYDSYRLIALYLAYLDQTLDPDTPTPSQNVSP